MGIGNIADTGMQAAMSNMEVISNNIANANTIGFKRSFINFADIYQSGNGTAGINIGLGVNVSAVTQDFATSGYEHTSGALDLSINKNGFFIVRDPTSGRLAYTRAGRFQQSNGYIINQSGEHLQGFPASNGVISPGSSPTDLQINASALPAKATSIANINLKLDSNSAVPTNTTFSPTDPDSYTYASTVQIYDSLGNVHNVTSYYLKTATANEWDVNVYVDGASLASGTMSFTSNGNLDTTTGLDNLAYTPTNGASAQTFTIDMAGSTQTGGNNVVMASSVDGYQAGTFNGVEMDNNGMVWMQYSNSQKLLAGQVALANFQSPTGLASVGNMEWVATSSSGNPVVNQSASTGNLTVGYLEESNVDLTSEMVSLINAQHAFQANAQVEQVYSQVMDEVIKL